MSRILFKEACSTLVKVRSMRSGTATCQFAAAPQLDERDHNRANDGIVKKTRDLAKQTMKTSVELLISFPEECRRSSSHKDEDAESGSVTPMTGLPQFTSVWPHLW